LISYLQASKMKKLKNFKEGFISGIGWSFGVTIGFVIISTLMVIILNSLGGIPLVGEGIASIVHETQQALVKRSPIIPQ
jgi:hypothetical protein